MPTSARPGLGVAQGDSEARQGDGRPGGVVQRDVESDQRARTREQVGGTRSAQRGCRVAQRRSVTSTRSRPTATVRV